MSSATDILNLYRHTDGDPSWYQEVEQAEQIDASYGRWPMLSAVRPDRAVAAPVGAARGESAYRADAPQFAAPEQVPAPIAQPASPLASAAPYGEPVSQARSESDAPMPTPATQQASLSGVFARLARTSPVADAAQGQVSSW